MQLLKIFLNVYTTHGGSSKIGLLYASIQSLSTVNPYAQLELIAEITNFCEKNITIEQIGYVSVDYVSMRNLTQ